MLGCIIQARINSSRLPGKVLKKIDNEKSVLDYVIEQLKNSKYLEKIVVATTIRNEDSKICDSCKNHGIDYFRGSELDVLDRYYKCAKRFSFDSIVRIPADKPLIDPNIVDETIQFYKNESFDYVTNFLKRTYPSGTEVEIFNFKSLETTWEKAKLPSEREHVTPFIYNSGEFKIWNIENKENLSNYRWAVDRKEDLELVKKLVSRIKIRPIKISSIIEEFEKDPELKNLNKNIDYFEGIKKSKDEDLKFLKNFANKIK